VSVTEKLSTVHFSADERAHIVVDGARCVGCADHPCLTFCPAQCFTPDGAGSVAYYHVGCLECGTCLLLCNREAVSWGYPAGGRGVTYRY